MSGWEQFNWNSFTLSRCMLDKAYISHSTSSYSLNSTNWNEWSENDASTCMPDCQNMQKKIQQLTSVLVVSKRPPLLEDYIFRRPFHLSNNLAHTIWHEKVRNSPRLLIGKWIWHMRWITPRRGNVTQLKKYKKESVNNKVKETWGKNCSLIRHVTC